MWLAAGSAFAAAVSAVFELASVDDDSLVVQTWRMYGLFLFAGLFALLAMRPHLHGGVWALVISNKAALTITTAVYLAQGGVAEAAKTVSWDGALTVVLVGAYFMSRAKAAG